MKRHALFVGVDKYADPTIQDLAFPAEDATEMSNVFRLLLKFDRVEKLINPAHSPDVEDAVESMTHGLGSGDFFLFFFAGHGFRVRENHVLVCAKDKYAKLEDEYAGLQVGLLKKIMRGPWNRMIVLDACQNDIRASRGMDCGVTSRDLALIHTSDDGASSSGFQIVVTSCSEGQKALEVSDLKHGLFTSAFLDSVTAFANDRRRIDLESLRTDLGVRMGGLISRYRLSGKQEPMFTMPADAARIVLLDGIAPTQVPPPLPDGATSFARGVLPGLAKKPEDRPAMCVEALNDFCTPQIRQSSGNGVSRREGNVAVPRKILFVTGLFLLALLVVWWCTDGHSWFDGTTLENGNGGENVSVSARPQSPVVPKTNEAKARRAQALYEQGKGRQILEEFSAYDAEMVPEIAFLKGIVYRDGMSGVPVDTRKAAQMFTIAANRGHVQAQLDLSLMYAQGVGVQRNIDQFIYWAEKAADQGVVDAAFNLGYMYFSADEKGKIKPDYAKALKYLKIAAEGGRPAACGYIGSMYVKGFGVSVDYMEAVKWFKMGADDGDALSENNLGYMYLKGSGVEKNTELAIKYLALADSHGSSGAAMSLGLMYENGDGVPKDLDKARRLYRRAKELGVGKEADKALERLD